MVEQLPVLEFASFDASYEPLVEYGRLSSAETRCEGNCELADLVDSADLSIPVPEPRTPTTNAVRIYEVDLSILEPGHDPRSTTPFDV